MSSKISILAGSGLTALAMLGTASAVDARAAHKHTACTPAADAAHRCARVKYVWVPVGTHHGKRHGHAHTAMASAPASASPADQAEMADLRLRVAQLTARLEATEAANRAVSDQVASNSAQTAALGTQFAATKAAVAGQVKSAINAGLPKGNWSADTQVSGRAYFNISNINQQAAGVKQVPSGTGFDIKRLYIGVNHTFSKTWSSQLVVDAQASGAYASGVNLAGQNVYIKNAFLQAKINDALIIRAGAADLPWVPFDEGLENHRYVEQTVMDRLKLATANSADWGVHVLGTLGDAKKLNVTYQVSAVNGGGFKNPTRSNSVDLEGRVAVNYKGLTAAVGGYTGKLAADTQGVVTTGQPIRTASRFSALVAYVQPRFRIGAEYFWTKDYSKAYVLGPSAVTFAPGVVAPNGSEEAAHGGSVWGSFNVTPKWSVFARGDSYTPNLYNYASKKENFYDVGVTYSPAKIVDLSLVYKRDVVKSNNAAFPAGTLSTQDVAAGAPSIGTSVLGAQGTYDEIGIFGQFRF